MEHNKMISDAVVGEDYLEHYGVKGMKWGVWNAETRARYSHVAKRGLKASGQAAIRGAKAVKAATKNHMAVNKVKRAAKRQRAHDRRKQRRELGMDPYKYAKLRNRTLKSHDPEVVMRGMHTLTDEELETKINRLQREDVVAKLAANRARERHQVNQARNQALAANPVYKFGEAYAKKLGNRAFNYVFPQPENGGGSKKNKGNSGKKNKGNSGEKNTDYSVNQQNQSSSSSNSSSGGSAKPGKGKGKNKGKGKKNKNKNRTTYESGRSYVESVENSAPSKRYSDSGQKYLTSGSGAKTLNDDIIDVDPIDPRSDRWR